MRFVTQSSRKFLMTNALYALIALLLIVLPQLLGKAELEPYSAGYCLYMVLVEFGTIVLPTLLFFLTPWGRESAKETWVQKPTAAILLMIPLAVCAYFCINGVTVLWMLLLQALGFESMTQMVPLPETGAQLGLGLLVIALTPALCEEFFFRGVLQPALHRRMHPAAAIVLGGCLFGLVHGQLAALPSHVLLGMGLCLAAYLTRSIWYTIVWHFIQNGIAVVIGYFSRDILAASQSVTGMDSMQMFAQKPLAMALSGGFMMVMFGAATALFFVLLWTATRSHRKEPILREEKPSPLAWLPMLPAAACVLYRYIEQRHFHLGRWSLMRAALLCVRQTQGKILEGCLCGILEAPDPLRAGGADRSAGRSRTRARQPRRGCARCCASKGNGCWPRLRPDDYVDGAGD